MIYENKSKEVTKDIARILAHVTHFIHPDIIKSVVESNIQFKKEFKKVCPELVDTFLFDGSDCVFPGVRRPINKEKAEPQWKNKIYKDKTILNDNTYPRHIWSYLVCGKGYSGGIKGTWNTNGFDVFELAHIFAHKTDERQVESECFKSNKKVKEPYSLFTSASNTVLIPKDLTKPTDQNEDIKIMFFKRYLELYCDIVKLPGLDKNKFDDSLLPNFYSSIKWNKPILPENWKTNVELLLKYREKHIIEKYNKYNT